MDITGFYYLHENGSLIYKPHATYEDMDSTFVKHYWVAREFGASPQVFLENLKVAKQMGARWEEIMRLVEFNHLSDYIPDCIEQLRN